MKYQCHQYVLFKHVQHEGTAIEDNSFPASPGKRSSLHGVCASILAPLHCSTVQALPVCGYMQWSGSYQHVLRCTVLEWRGPGDNETGTHKCSPDQTWRRPVRSIPSQHTLHATHTLTYAHTHTQPVRSQSCRSGLTSHLPLPVVLWTLPTSLTHAHFTFISAF